MSERDMTKPRTQLTILTRPGGSIQTKTYLEKSEVLDLFSEFWKKDLIAIPATISTQSASEVLYIKGGDIYGYVVIELAVEGKVSLVKPDMVIPSDIKKMMEGGKG